MKIIQNKATSFPLDGTKNVETSYATILLLSLDSTPDGGFTPSVLRARARVDRVLSEAKPNADISLEDADFKTLRGAFSSTGWRFRHPAILDLLDILEIE